MLVAVVPRGTGIILEILQVYVSNLPILQILISNLKDVIVFLYYQHILQMINVI